jgi:hypothetical protein
VAEVIHADVLTEGVVVGEKPAHEDLVHDRHVVRVGLILRLDDPAAQQARADGFKVVRAHNIVTGGVVVGIC